MALSGPPPGGSMPGLRSGLLVAWGSAFLTGRATLATAADAIRGDDGDVSFGPQGLPPERALTRLRADGATRLVLVLPVPGDVRGLPGPGPFTTAALEVGEGVLVLGGPHTGLVPMAQLVGPPGDTFTVTSWDWYDDLSVAARDLTSPGVAESEAELRLALAEATRELDRLDAARWRPGLDEPLSALRAARRRGTSAAESLPAGYPARARALLAQADQLAQVLALVERADPEGGAPTAPQIAARSETLRTLGSAVRRARVAALNGFDDVVRVGLGSEPR